MENSELIRNIIVSAQNSAAAIIANAKDDSEETKAGVKAELDIKRTAALAAAEKEAELLIARKLSVAALEKNKALLSARQKVLKSVYEQVMQKILNMSDNIYREFIGTLIKNTPKTATASS